MPRQDPIPSSVTLAWWGLRQRWHWLMVMGLGILAAVVIICAVPLFSQVALTAGARAVLTASPQDTEIELEVDTKVLSTQIAAADNTQFRHFTTAALGPYLSGYSQAMLQTPALSLAIPGLEKDTLALTGVSVDQARSHLRLLQGRLPNPSSPNLEVVLTQRTATSLQVMPGATIPLQFAFYSEQTPGVNPRSVTTQLLLHVVGMIALDESDPFWHAQDFNPERTDFASGYRAIMSSDAFLSTITQLAQLHGGKLAGFDAPPALVWYFFLDASRVAISNLDDLIARLNNAQFSLDKQTVQSPALQNAQFLGPAMNAFGNPGSLERFRSRLPVILIPLVILTIQILLLILLFVSMMVNIFIDRQAEFVALLHSRGATRRLIFSAFVLQTLAFLPLALLAGPLLALLIVRVLGSQALSSSDQGALSSVLADPLQAALGLSLYALIAVAGAGITMMLSIWSAARRDVLSLRRALARPTHRLIWQRLRLDMVAAIIALSGYGASLLLTHSGALDARTNQILFLPISLVGPLFLLIAAVLFFLRCFPALLGFLARQTARRTSAPAMLALAQMSRAPQHFIRLLLLLSLSVSFGIFTLVFTSSEAQQMNDVAAQQVGADFSGPIPFPVGSHPDANVVESAYRAIPGVISATIGNVTDGVAQKSGQVGSVQIRAIDTRTFAQTAIWTHQDSSQPLAVLLASLAAPQAEIGASSVVPALVDAVTWDTLQLTPGARFNVSMSGSAVTITFEAIAEVQHIPTINDSLQTSGSDDYTTPGGLLVDLTRYTQVFEQLSQTGNQLDMPLLPPAVNYIWLRTSDSPSALAAVRAALTQSSLSLEVVYDRRAMLAQMQHDPLSLALNGVLILGTCTAGLLALLGSQQASALHARSRLTSLALLRALGSTPRQMVSVLSWEQGIVYCLALVLGGLLGTLLVLTVVPALAFTDPILPGSAISSTEYYVIQHVLPVQIVVPPPLGLALVILAAIYALALALTTWMVAKPSLSQTLRLNAD
jgi:ABC-type lipoprotein release transport system permease subunit